MIWFLEVKLNFLGSAVSGYEGGSWHLLAVLFRRCFLILLRLPRGGKLLEKGPSRSPDPHLTTFSIQVVLNKWPVPT